MAIGAKRPATLDDLARVSDKAELIGGRIVYLMPSGEWPGLVAFEIASSLREHARRTGRGVAYADNVGFTVPRLASGRESFSPVAAYRDGPRIPGRLRFVPEAPTFAVEVRSEGDSGPAAERAMAAKRADYFEAGTMVVWDVDPVAECVHVYRADDPEHSVTYRRGDVAEAEPAVPGWRVAVDELFA